MVGNEVREEARGHITESPVKPSEEFGFQSEDSEKFQDLVGLLDLMVMTLIALLRRMVVGGESGEKRESQVETGIL